MSCWLNKLTRIDYTHTECSVNVDRRGSFNFKYSKILVLKIKAKSSKWKSTCPLKYWFPRATLGIYNDIDSSNTIVGRIENDDTQSIGKRYRRQDEIGTPLCITIDFQSLEDQTVTIRTRDSMDQIRSPINSLVTNIQEKLTI